MVQSFDLGHIVLLKSALVSLQLFNLVLQVIHLLLSTRQVRLSEGELLFNYLLTMVR